MNAPNPTRAAFRALRATAWRVSRDTRVTGPTVNTLARLATSPDTESTQKELLGALLTVNHRRLLLEAVVAVLAMEFGDLAQAAALQDDMQQWRQLPADTDNPLAPPLVELAFAALVYGEALRNRAPFTTGRLAGQWIE